MTRALLVVAGLIASVVVAVPGAASADDDPIVVSKADGTVRYVDPTLDNADTMRIVGTLSSVVRDDFDTAQAHELDPVIVTESGAVVPVDLGGASVPPGPVVAELLNGPTLEKALDGRTAGTPVDVATASVDPLPVAAAAVTPASHRIYVARLANQSGVASSAAIGSQIDAASQWWSAESGTTFSRVGAVRSVTASASSCGFANPDSVWNQVAPVFPGIDFGAGTGNHLVVVTSSSCGPTGIGTVGSTLNDGGYTLMVGTPSIFTATFAHELGHNVGLEHANRECSGCSYQNAYSVMGFAVTFGGQATVTPSLDSVYRAQLGLQDTGEITTVGPGESATITLVPRGLASGNRGVEVRTGTGVTYWVDLRTNSGRDRGSLFTLGGDVGIALSGVRYQPGVVIERQRAGAMALTYPNRATSLMDNVSGGSVRGAFGAGSVFSRDGVTIRVDQISGASSAVVAVNPEVVAPVPMPTLVSATPTISGKVKVGRRLTAHRGTWTSGTSFTYQWYANGSKISKATKSTYTISKKYKGKRIQVRVTGKKAGYESVSRYSAKTSTVRR